MRQACLLLLALQPGHATAAEYTFTSIFRDTDDTTLYFQSGSLNDLGDVAFLAFDNDTVIASLYVALAGGSPQPLAPVTFTGSARTQINAARSIGYRGPDGEIRIRAAGGSDTIALDSSGPIASISSGFDMNATGQIAARVTFDDGREGVVIAAGNSATTVFAAPDADVGIGSFPALNDAGVAAFRVLDIASGLDTIYRGAAAPATSILDALTPPFDCDPAVPSGCFGSRVDIDDAGRVLVNGFFAAAGAFLDEGYFIQGDDLVTVADTTTAPFEFLRDNGRLNSRGDVVFLAQETDEGVFRYAYYTGPDPLEDRLIGPDDALLGSTAAGLSPYSFDMNEAGQILFAALLATGESVLVRADPVPEPAGAALAALVTLAACGGARAQRG